MSKLPRRSRLHAAVITAAALLIAQFGAMAHAYSHDPGFDRTTARQSNPASHEVCSDCLNFAPLLAAAGAPAASPLIVPHARIPSQRAERSARADLGPHLAFRSRAPPVSH